MRHCIGFVLLVIVGQVLLSQRVAGAETRPNILFIVGDDVGYADVGFHNCRDIPTPNLDALRDR